MMELCWEKYFFPVTKYELFAFLKTLFTNGNSVYVCGRNGVKMKVTGNSSRKKRYFDDEFLLFFRMNKIQPATLCYQWNAEKDIIHLLIDVSVIGVIDANNFIGYNANKKAASIKILLAILRCTPSSF